MAAALTGTGPVFISYSRADASWRDRFAVVLSPVVRNLRIAIWTDDRLTVGEYWRDELEEAIERASLALLLVSPDSLASSFIMDQELPALERAGAVLAPVLVRPCLWRSEPRLAERQWA